MSAKPIKTLPLIALISAMILWSSSFIALKIAFRVYDPMVVIFGRMFVASLCFLLFVRRFMATCTYEKGDYRTILFMAFCEPCLYFIFEARAIENTTASQAGLITAMLPILVMIAASFFLKETVNTKAKIGAALAVASVCWLTLESSPSSDAPHPILGNFYEFLAMVCATGYTISLKKLTSRYSPFFLTAIQAFTGSLFFFPFLLMPGVQIPRHFDPLSGGAIIYLGAVITLGAYGLYNFGVKHVPASRASIYVNLIPVFSVILGWLVLHETLSFRQMIAAAFVVGGVLISQQ